VSPAAPGVLHDPGRLPRAERDAWRRVLPPRGERLLPLLSGVLLVICFPPFHLLLPPFVALVPFLVFLADRSTDATGRWAALRGGYLLGLVYFGLTLYWLVIALVYYSSLAMLAWLLTVCILAGFSALFAAGVVYVRERLPVVPLALTVALFWTTLEWVQGHLGDVSFPWLGLGSSLTGFPRVSGAADLVGARGLTFWLALVNGLVASAFVAWRRGERGSRGGPAHPGDGMRAALGPAILALLAIAIPVGYGFWRAATLALIPVARVAVVQPNIPEDLKLDRERSLDSSLVALTNLTLRIPPGNVDLVVWPEVALQAFVAAPGEAALRERVRALSRQVAAPILVGAYGYGLQPRSATPLIYNSALLVTAAGVQGSEYDKQYLVPIVERVPFIDPAWLEPLTGPLHWFGGLGRGNTTPTFPAGRVTFGTMICYESIFAPLGRAYRREGAAFLVNMTNDSWYGRPPFWARTSALWQHPAHLVLRAIENRVGVARAANTGISEFVDPLGRTYEPTPLFVPAVRVATVYGTRATTLFTVLGDWLADLAALATVLLLVLCRLRRPRSMPTTA